MEVEALINIPVTIPRSLYYGDENRSPTRAEKNIIHGYDYVRGIMTLLKIANKVGAASSRDRAKMALLQRDLGSFG